MSFFNKSGGISFIIAGLGNPDKKYDLTRHNAGFHAVDKIAEENGIKLTKVRFKALTAEIKVDGVGCLLMKPQTYMNLSGDALEAARAYYKLDMSHVLVFYDDISLSPGSIRIRRKGTHGGHNGIKSIIEQTGEEAFPRVKLGVGAKPHPDYNLADWVLSSFKKEELLMMEKAYAECDSIMRLIISDKIDEAMNKYNS